jgi:hypothetical protein
VVRRTVGYLRYDTEADLDVLNELYTHLRLITNFFVPEAKLIAKTRDGAKVRKRYDTPATPYQRLLADKRVPTKTKRALTATYRGRRSLVKTAAAAGREVDVPCYPS